MSPGGALIYDFMLGGTQISCSANCSLLSHDRPWLKTITLAEEHEDPKCGEASVGRMRLEHTDAISEISHPVLFCGR